MPLIAEKDELWKKYGGTELYKIEKTKLIFAKNTSDYFRAHLIKLKYQSFEKTKHQFVTTCFCSVCNSLYKNGNIIK